MQHATAVVFIIHIDKVDDDNTAQITQAKLACDGLRRFYIGIKDGVIEVAMADKRAGVDVDGGHRFGLINNQIATRFQLNLTLQRTLDFVFNVIEIKYRLASGVMPFRCGTDNKPTLLVAVGADHLFQAFTLAFALNTL